MLRSDCYNLHLRWVIVLYMRWTVRPLVCAVDCRFVVRLTFGLYVRWAVALYVRWSVTLYVR